jgi:hypothetical protein
MTDDGRRGAAVAIAGHAEWHARTMCMRAECLALAARVGAARAHSANVRHRTARDRASWRAWRAGLAALRRHASADPQSHVLHVCTGCDAVCFTPPGAGAPDAAPAAWVEAPEWVRRRWRDDWRGPTLAPARCPGCAPAESPEAMVVRLFAELEAAAADAAARTGWLDAERAVDEALERAVARLADRRAPVDLAAFAGALRDLTRRLRDGSRAAPHFHPPLRRA